MSYVLDPYDLLIFLFFYILYENCWREPENFKECHCQQLLPCYAHDIFERRICTTRTVFSAFQSFTNCTFS